MDVTFCINLQNPPAGVEFGIQKGAGSNYETVQTQRSDGGDLQFILTLPLKSYPQRLKEPQFTGPFVQGKSLEQFFYINVGTYAGQDGGWSRRMKIPLYCITWEMIDELNHHRGATFSTNIPGTAKDGGPNCATIKPSKKHKVCKSLLY